MKYKAAIPSFGADQQVKFRFSYYGEDGSYRMYPRKGYLNFNYGSTDVRTTSVSNVTLGFLINQNYPNPFNSGTTVSFVSAFKDDALVEIYTILGEKVKILHAGVINSGLNEFIWDGRDDAGNPLATGVYIARVKMGTDIQASKMLLLR